MKKEENIQKVNVVCLTDGEANPMAFNEWYDPDCEYYKPYMKRSSLCHQSGKIFFLRDPKTGFTEKISSSVPFETTKGDRSVLHSEITDYNWIGIRICSKSELGRSIVRHFAHDDIRYLLIWTGSGRKNRSSLSLKKQVGSTEVFLHA